MIGTKYILHLHLVPNDCRGQKMWKRIIGKQRTLNVTTRIVQKNGKQFLCSMCSISKGQSFPAEVCDCRPNIHTFVMTIQAFSILYIYVKHTIVSFI